VYVKLEHSWDIWDSSIQSKERRQTSRVFVCVCGGQPDSTGNCLDRGSHCTLSHWIPFSAPNFYCHDWEGSKEELAPLKNWTCRARI